MSKIDTGNDAGFYKRENNRKNTKMRQPLSIKINIFLYIRIIKVENKIISFLRFLRRY